MYKLIDLLPKEVLISWSTVINDKWLHNPQLTWHSFNTGASATMRVTQNQYSVPSWRHHAIVLLGIVMTSPSHYFLASAVSAAATALTDVSPVRVAVDELMSDVVDLLWRLRSMQNRKHLMKPRRNLLQYRKHLMKPRRNLLKYRKVNKSVSKVQ